MPDTRKEFEQKVTTDALVRLIQPKKPPQPICLNNRNSFYSKSSMDYLCHCLEAPEYCLTALSLKYCFLSFEHMLQLSNVLRFNKTLVKLDLSNNGLKSCTANFLMEAVEINNHLSDLRLHGNFLDDVFAERLAEVLISNQVLYTVDISKNPIGQDGAKKLLHVLLQYNDTIGNLGDLEQNVYMGVRIREELRQAINLNNSSHDKKKAVLEELREVNKKKHVDTKSLEQNSSSSKTYPASAQAAYPLLKPVVFTNVIEDDYLEGGVWVLK